MRYALGTAKSLALFHLPRRSSHVFGLYSYLFIPSGLSLCSRDVVQPGKGRPPETPPQFTRQALVASRWGADND